MSDYIKREDAIEAIAEYYSDRDNAVDTMRTECIKEAVEQAVEDAIDSFNGKYNADDKVMARESICTVGSADVVEVVRCKDCKHHEKFCFDDSKLLCWVHDTDIVVSPTDYCSYGERKEQEHE